MSANAETWFEVRIDRDLALLFQRIVNVHSRIGQARRAELRARLAAAIPGAPVAVEPVPVEQLAGLNPGLDERGLARLQAFEQLLAEDDAASGYQDPECE